MIQIKSFGVESDFFLKKRYLEGSESNIVVLELKKYIFEMYTRHLWGTNKIYILLLSYISQFFALGGFCTFIREYGFEW